MIEHGEVIASHRHAPRAKATALPATTAAAWAVLYLAACATPADGDVIGPFTGTTRRYALDAIAFPMNNTQARAYGGDLNGDGSPDNQLGSVIFNLMTQNDVTTHAFDMIAGGAVPSALEITADDFATDPSVGVRYLGTPDATYVELGGAFTDGWFRSNLTAGSIHTGEADLVLPVFMEADPSTLHAIGMEMVLAPDGSGGFDATVHAGVANVTDGPNGGPPERELQDAMYRGFVQMIASEPSAHRVVMNLLDKDKDGALTFDEVAHNSLVVSLTAADVTIDGTMALSLGFRAHFSPCASGQCLAAARFDRCYDRRRDGDETDIDCGGSCRACEAGATCALPDDCETNVCDQGRCGPPSCSDGRRDGLESDVDCGANCPRCALGQRCYLDGDCLTGKCGIGSFGNYTADTCTAP